MIYHYDLSGHLIAETDNSGNMLKAYVWFANQPLAMIAPDASIYYFHNDHLGTPQKLTDSTGAIVWAADYLPFGQADVSIATVDNNLRFAGQYYDNETGLHYNYHRYYDPSVGRYLTPDPIGLAGGVNLYSYVQNDPVIFSDPLGLWSLSFGFSSMGIDIAIPLYNSNNGYFGSPSFGTSTTLFGVGMQWSFDNPLNEPCSSDDPKNDVPVSAGYGPSKYNFTGSFNQDFSRLGVTYGIGVGLPGFNYSTSMENFAKGLANILEKAVRGLSNDLQDRIK